MADAIADVTRSLKKLRKAAAHLFLVVIGYMVFLGLVAREILRHLQ
jgi:hypothetical protein